MKIPREENLLSRWSRRKNQTQELALEEDQVISSLQKKQSQEDLSASLSISSDDESPVQIEPEALLTDADMPPIESLSEDSDFTGFMSRGVSDELRNVALRKMYKAASFNVRDGLDEYDDDYTSFEKLGDIVTCDMKHQIEMEAKRKLEQEAEMLLKKESGAIPDSEQDFQSLTVHGSETEAETETGQPELTPVELTSETVNMNE